MPLVRETELIDEVVILVVIDMVEDVDKEVYMSEDSISDVVVVEEDTVLFKFSFTFLMSPVTFIMKSGMQYQQKIRIM